MTEPIYNLRLLQKAILIQSNAETPDEVFAFVKQFRSEISATTPLVVMPTTYP